MSHGPNVPNVACLIRQKIVKLSALYVQIWGTPNIDVGKNQKKGRCTLDEQTF
jgi:hypothetical protein